MFSVWSLQYVPRVCCQGLLCVQLTLWRVGTLVYFKISTLHYYYVLFKTCVLYEIKILIL